VQLAHLPTRLEPLERLGAHLGGPPIYLKRDDCTGLATGGNKARKLEFLLAAAEAEHADTLITFGAYQSNHARQTAAAAAKRGHECHLILIEMVEAREPAQNVSGNLLLDSLLGANLHRVADHAAAAVQLAALLEDLRRRGRRPYVIPGGGSNATGALGYVAGALELAEQYDALGSDAQHPLGTVYNATSSAGTQVGLTLGLHACGSGARVQGVNVYDPDRAGLVATAAQLMQETASLLGVDPSPADALNIQHDFLGAGYGIPSEAGVEAIRLLARLEGIVLDPVYTGKAMAALIDAVKRGVHANDAALVFLHTGGAAGLFAYVEAMHQGV
jgi:L-cysteate sulfo-lyase